MDKTKIETRLADISLLENVEEKMVLEGYALLFNQETLIGDETKGYIESIDAYALERTNLKDVPMKYNHNDLS